jgi:hypothetical protein
LQKLSGAARMSRRRAIPCFRRTAIGSPMMAQSGGLRRSSLWRAPSLAQPSRSSERRGCSCGTQILRQPSGSQDINGLALKSIGSAPKRRTQAMKSCARRQATGRLRL